MNPARYLNGCIFDIKDVLATEALYPELVIQAEVIQDDSGLKMVGDKFVFIESQLIKKDDLYKRWPGATDEEIAEHVNNGELSAYNHYKGPINNVIWCTPGIVYYRGQVDWSNPERYDYNDTGCDYFLFKDMEQCEAEHPEYTGDITPESLGLVQVGTSGTPEEEPEYIKAESLRKDMKLSPVQFVDYLRNNRELCLFGNGVDDLSRRLFYRASREQAADMLDDMFIHCLDVETHKKRMEEESSFMTDIPFGGDTPPFPVIDDDSSRLAELESQLAEAQRKFEDVDGVRRWNKQLLTEQAELQNFLAEKDARIAELETQLAANRQNLDSPPPSENEPAESEWEDSVTAVCKALLAVFKEGRTDWVSGQDPGTGDTDSAGKETFRTLLKRMHHKREPGVG